MAPKLIEAPPQTISSHRRITSLKNSTISWFKNTNRPFTSGGDRERSTGSFDNSQNNVLGDLPEVTAQQTSDTAIHHVHACSFEASMARDLGTSDGTFDDCPQPINTFEEIALEEHRQAFKKKRVFSQNDLLQDVPETPVTGDFPCAGPSGQERPKRRSTKFKMALSLLRRRSNSNMRKGHDDQPEESPREPPHSAVESRPSTSTVQKAGPPPSRSSRGSVRLQKLNKQPSILTPRRRATVDVASVVAEEGLEEVLEMRQDPRHWESERIRAVSSHSSLPLTPVASRVDEDVRSSVGNDDMLAAAAEQYTILQPRPSSARRNLKQRNSIWSSREDTSSRQGNYLTIEEADRHKIGSRDRTGSRGSSRTSFAGNHNNPSELETRVRELEMQVASLQIFISNHVQGQRLKTPTNSTSRPTSRFAHRRFSSPSLKVGTAEEVDVDIPTQRSPTKARFQILPLATPIKSLEDNRPSTPKTRTDAFITDPGLDESFITLMPSNRLNEAQYTGLITMIQREQNARRRLESQVTKMQEQMTMLLQRTVYDTDHLSTYSVNNMHDLRRKPSTEVPTPELTPPRPRLPSDAFDGISLRGAPRNSDEVAIATGEDDDNNIFGIRFGQEDVSIEPNSTSTSIGNKTVTPIEPSNPVATLATIEASPLPASPALSLSRLTKIH